jgi:hypothetical protein
MESGPRAGTSTKVSMPTEMKDLLLYIDISASDGFDGTVLHHSESYPCAESWDKSISLLTLNLLPSSDR